MQVQEDLRVVADVLITIRGIDIKELLFRVRLMLEPGTELRISSGEYSIVVTDVIPGNALENITIVVQGSVLSVRNDSDTTQRLVIKAVLSPLREYFEYDTVVHGPSSLLRGLSTFPFTSRKLGLNLSFWSNSHASVRVSMKLSRDLVFYRATLPDNISHNYDSEKSINTYVIPHVYVNPNESAEINLYDARIRFRPVRMVSIALLPLIYITLLQTVVNAYSIIFASSTDPSNLLSQILNLSIYATQAGGIIIFLSLYFYIKKLLDRVLSLPTGITTLSFMLGMKLLYLGYTTLLSIYFITPYLLPGYIADPITSITYYLMKLASYFSIASMGFLTLLAVVYAESWKIPVAKLLILGMASSLIIANLVTIILDGVNSSALALEVLILILLPAAYLALRRLEAR